MLQKIEKRKIFMEGVAPSIKNALNKTGH